MAFFEPFVKRIVRVTVWGIGFFSSLFAKGKVHSRASVKVFLAVMLLEFLGAIISYTRTLGTDTDVRLLAYLHVSYRSKCVE